MTSRTRDRANGPRERRQRLLDALESAFPDAEDAESPDVEFVRAPGRVNLIGDHTDYNDGLVLPAAIGLETWIALRRRRDGLVRIASLQAAGQPEARPEAKAAAEPQGRPAVGSAARAGSAATAARAAKGAAAPGAPLASSFWIDEVAPPDPALPAVSHGWIDYVAGTAWSLREAGLQLRGFDGIVDSTIPPGAGLSSSAALELSAALAMLGPMRIVAPTLLASLAQRAEREYVGVDCGIMDQFSSAAGRAGRAILLDCRSLDSRYVALPPGVTVVVCDTGSPRDLRATAYNERRAECGRAVALLAEREPSIASLRDVDAATLRRLRAVLPETLGRRARHVVTENDRVVAAAAALEAGDLEELGRLFAASHESLRDDFGVGSPALDEMVDVATHVPGVVAARVTGAGFGGCSVNLVRDEAVPALTRAVAGEYPRRTGLTPRVFAVAIADGAGNLPTHGSNL